MFDWDNCAADATPQDHVNMAMREGTAAAHNDLVNVAKGEATTPRMAMPQAQEHANVASRNATSPHDPTLYDKEVKEEITRQREPISHYEETKEKGPCPRETTSYGHIRRAGCGANSPRHATHAVSTHSIVSPRHQSHGPWINSNAESRDISRVLGCYPLRTAPSTATIVHTALTKDWSDLNCTFKNPCRITNNDIALASTVIKTDIVRTPCVRSCLSRSLGMELYLKKEFLQKSGSVKDRGARNALLQLCESEQRNGVITVSTGNHSIALSYQAAQLSIPCTVVVPINTSISVLKKCTNFGANVIVSGKDLTEAKEVAMKMAKMKALTFISAYDHPHVIAGQGTVGPEICEQVQDVDAIIVPIGGGGLIAGIASAIKTSNPKIQIIGVESDRVPSFSNAMSEGNPVETELQPSLADGLSVPTVGYNAFASAAAHIDKVVLVPDEWIALSILRFFEEEKCVVEGAGAIGLAAILAGKLEELKGKRVVVVLSGGNIDTSLFGKCLEQGLIKEGRIMQFDMAINDRPGGLAEVTNILAELGVSIKEVRSSVSGVVADIHTVRVSFLCEVNGNEHSQRVKDKLMSQNFDITFS